MKELLKVNPESGGELITKLPIKMGGENSANFMRIHNRGILLIKTWNEIAILTVIGSSMKEFCVFIPIF